MKVIILFAFLATVHSTLSSECGGTIGVGRGETVIEYLPEGGYKNYEFCVWALLPTAGYTGLAIDYQPIDVEETYDGVTTYNWDKDGVVTSRRITYSNSSSTMELEKPYAAITFSSDHVYTGKGFKVTITGTGTLEGDFNYEGSVLSQPEGTFSYPEVLGLQNYTPNDRVAVVVQPTVLSYTDLTEVSIDYTDINDDDLIAYRLYRYNNGGTARLIGRTNGTNPDGVPSLFSTSNLPRLLVFVSNSNVKTGNGFFISWKPKLA